MNKGIIQVEDKFYKKCKVVMLPTEKATNIFKRPTELFHSIGLKPQTGNSINSEVIGQHLYILSDEEIKEGDWYYNTVVKVVVKSTNSINFYSKDTFKKIIATTDPELKLPRPSDAFLKAYCEKGGIDKVLLEVVGKQYNIGDVVNPDEIERIVSTSTFYSDIFKGYYFLTNDDKDGWRLDEYQLKVAPDNTITIKRTEDSWNREKVEKLCREAFQAGRDYEGSRYDLYRHSSEDKWIEENL